MTPLNLNKLKHYVLTSIYILVALFVLSLFIVPLLHPDHKITKTGIISNVITAGNPFFYQVRYTITFQDGQTIQVEAEKSIPLPVGKTVAISYSAREKKLLGVQIVPAVTSR